MDRVEQFMCLKTLALSLKTKMCPTCSELIYWHSGHFFILLYSFHNVPGVVQNVRISLLSLSLSYWQEKKKVTKVLTLFCPAATFTKVTTLNQVLLSARADARTVDPAHSSLQARDRLFVKRCPTWQQRGADTFIISWRLPPATEHQGLFCSSWMKLSCVSVLKIKNA